MKSRGKQIVGLIIVLLLFVGCRNDVCDCPDALIGKWEAVEFVSVEDADYPKTEDYNPTITFKSDGSYDLALDINACFGEYSTRYESFIQFSDTGCTEACCDSQFSEKFVEMLTLVSSYTIEGDTLKLHVSAWGWIELKR